MIELTMPKLSDSMEQGTILTWLKGDGEQVEAGEDLLEIETDKATVTHAAEAGGTLQIIAPEGSTVEVGAPIAHVGSPADTPRRTPPPEANGGSSAVEVPVPEDGATTVSDATVRATPLARRVAAAHGISLEMVVGSGPLGRITRGDVITKAGIASPPTARPIGRPAEAPKPAPARSAQPAQAAQAAQAGKGAIEVVEPTRVQSLIARRMAEAKATVPHFQVQTEVAIDDAAAFRQQLKELESTAPSFNDLIVKATGLALRRHPLANGSYRDGHFELYSRVNVGIAVAAENALLVPTIFDADQKSLGTIATESRRLAERARDGAITPSELSGATFTVSNLGMYGMTAITPVVNPPQAAILGVGAIRDSLARADGEIVDRRLLTLTLSCDHRILYGAEAAEFLATIRELLERPLRLAI
jgi:pyruvate dehydrogenase E2 component (dihydrolipoamide acetyltransferase)